MKKLFIAALGLFAANDSYASGCKGPYCGGYGGPQSAGQPVFHAAPWYLYWPYNGHFQTPAPMQGAFYGPPGHGGQLVSPYFPAPGR